MGVCFCRARVIVSTAMSDDGPGRSMIAISLLYARRSTRSMSMVLDFHQGRFDKKRIRHVNSYLGRRFSYCQISFDTYGTSTSFVEGVRFLTVGGLFLVVARVVGRPMQ